MASRISPAAKRQFFRLVEQGMAPVQAAQHVGFSRQSAWRIMRGLDADGSMARSLVEADRREEAQPQPRSWHELSPDAQQALRDFGTFAELFLCRRKVAWRSDAAMRTVEALTDRSERSFLVLNMPPGSGKSTLFTHDIPAWLICGGGICDPKAGRAVRLMLGAFGMSVATHYVGRLRRLLESPRRYFDKTSQRTAEAALVREFGRFKPRQQGATWANDEFVVEQMTDVDLTEKEPTVQAASRERGFLGERVDLAVWDDLVTTQNTRNVEVRNELVSWYEDEAESRVEPGGALLLVGQRLGADDLYRNRLDVSFNDDAGQTRRRYQHIVFPAHVDASCDGEHRQWDGGQEPGAGCLLDAERLNWRELQVQRESNPRRFRTLMQQEDVDPAGSLIDDAWLVGGTDRDGFVVPGCFDDDRSFGEWPQGVGHMIDFVSVDPSAGNWWGVQWWAYQPESKVRYLIRGFRSARFKAGDLLEWNVEGGDLRGLMQDWQLASARSGHPIRVWVIEGNSAFRHLAQYQHFRVWQRRWPMASVILHQTQRNKTDEHMGVEALLPGIYKQGLARIPHRHGDLEALNFVRAFRRELTQFPESSSSDLVMAHWMAEWNLGRILAAARRPHGSPVVDAQLPRYLTRQHHAIPHKASGI
jgi:hypothetical protein